MTNKRVTNTTFVFEYKGSKKKAGATITVVEKEAEFRCKSNLAVELGIDALSTTSSTKTITIPAYERTPTRVGGVILGSGATGQYQAEATTIPVRSSTRVVPHKLARGREAIVIFAAANAESKSKLAEHRTGKFIFPSQVTVVEANVALSMLFSQIAGIVSVPGTPGLLLPYWTTGNGSTRYSFITDKTQLTELEAAYGVKVALSAADVTSINAATG